MTSPIRLGGVFLRAKDPKALYLWYQQHLGLEQTKGAFAFPAPVQTSGQPAQVICSLFTHEAAYFPTAQPAMLNLQVDDLDAVLDRLTADGVTVDPKRENYSFGRFGWCTDLEGNRVELWQPVEEEDDPA